MQKPIVSDAEFYKRENSRLYVDIEIRNADNSKLRKENSELLQKEKETRKLVFEANDLSQIASESLKIMNEKYMRVLTVLSKLRKGHSVKLGCNKPLGGICSCGADNQNDLIDEVLK